MLSTDPEDQTESLQEIVENAVMEAQQAVLRKAPGGGTTITIALTLGEQVTLGQVGDSRAYFIYLDGRIQAVTQDHSLVRRLIDLGQLTEDQGMVDSRRNVLYRALGQIEPFRPDIETKAFPNPGYLLLCSDGLWGVVPQAEIFHLVRSAKDPSQACHRLIEAANSAGGPDNISAILVQFLN
jgi:serine/threonine protein phosphatase PrpC